MDLGNGLPISLYGACLSLHSHLMGSVLTTHFLSSEYVPVSNCEPRSEWHAAHSQVEREGGEFGVEIKTKPTGCLLCCERLALPPLVHGEDFEVISDPRGQPGDFCKGVPADGQPLPMLPGQVDGDHIHTVTGYRTLWGCPHDGDLHICHLHKLQVPGRGNFI